MTATLALQLGCGGSGVGAELSTESSESSQTTIDTESGDTTASDDSDETSEADDDTTSAETETDTNGDGDGDGDGDALRVYAGGTSTCALVEGVATCWGANTFGQLGVGNMEAIGDDEPASSAMPALLGGDVTSLAGRADHWCANLTSGSSLCWGRGDAGQNGQTGGGNVGDDELPSSVPPIELETGSVSAISVGHRQTCMLSSAGEGWCFGLGLFGVLGSGALPSACDFPGATCSTDPGCCIGDFEPPLSNGPVGSEIQKLEVGGDIACALDTEGEVRCWGFGAYTGNQTMDNVGDNESPWSLPPLALGFEATDISVGGDAACAINAAGELYCWGRGASGATGSGPETIGDDEPPTSAGALPLPGAVIAVDMGLSHGCALLEGGALHCWGWNGDGRLGLGHTDTIGDDESISAAPAVDVGADVVQVSAGGTHTCVVTSAGGVRCWGAGGDGQLGYGDTENVGDDESPASVGDVPW